ncbi:MAG: CDP-alcohol phosphatidyltransferase family protein [Oscillospiraceae bacterium]|nr:CDP-alcohol phosphatidyltransferase family protein [Oscillospiraceae bacterium]
MDKKIKADRTSIPNAITLLRIAGTVALVFLRPLTAVFFIVYTLCGLSDVLDGFLARRWKCESAFGARLDSVADLSFYTVMLLRLMPILVRRLPAGYWYSVAAALCIRLCAYAVAAIRYRRFASLHTYGNKLTGAVLFLLPYLLRLRNILVPCIAISAVACLASLEELLLHLLAADYDPNVKSLCHLLLRGEGKGQAV